MIVIFYIVGLALKLLNWVAWETSSPVGKAAQISGMRVHSRMEEKKLVFRRDLVFFTL